MIKSIIVTQNKIKVVCVGKVGPPGATIFYNFLDYSLNADGTGIKNIDYGCDLTLTSELVEDGKYRLTADKPVFLNARISVYVLNNDNPGNHLIPKATVISDVILDIACADYESGGYTNSDLAITIKRLKA